jgi:hypothetical protein
MKPPALKRTHPAFQNIKLLNFAYFCGSILLPWSRILPTKINADPWASGSVTLLTTRDYKRLMVGRILISGTTCSNES